MNYDETEAQFLFKLSLLSTEYKLSDLDFELSHDYWKETLFEYPTSNCSLFSTWKRVQKNFTFHDVLKEAIKHFQLLVAKQNDVWIWILKYLTYLNSFSMWLRMRKYIHFCNYTKQRILLFLTSRTSFSSSIQSKSFFLQFLICLYFTHVVY